MAVIAAQKVLEREASHPQKDMTWYELSKYLRHHRHPVVVRSRWETRRYAATFASSSVVGQQAAEAVEQLGISHLEQVVVADGAG